MEQKELLELTNDIKGIKPFLRSFVIIDVEALSVLTGKSTEFLEGLLYGMFPESNIRTYVESPKDTKETEPKDSNQADLKPGEIDKRFKGKPISRKRAEGTFDVLDFIRSHSNVHTASDIAEKLSLDNNLVGEILRNLVGFALIEYAYIGSSNGKEWRVIPRKENEVKQLIGLKKDLLLDFFNLDLHHSVDEFLNFLSVHLASLYS